MEVLNRQKALWYVFVTVNGEGGWHRVWKERDLSTWRVLGRGGQLECSAGHAQKAGSQLCVGATNCGE